MEIDNETMRVAIVLSFKTKFEKLMKLSKDTNDMRLAASYYREIADLMDNVHTELEKLKEGE